ncbi:MAG: hypothetical protein ACK5MQ_09295, partial [Pikeienuella sp.]
MLPRPAEALWAPREACAIMALPAPPAMEIVGGFQGAPIPTAPEDVDFPDIADLIAPWSAAAAAGDRPALAR